MRSLAPSTRPPVILVPVLPANAVLVAPRVIPVPATPFRKSLRSTLSLAMSTPFPIPVSIMHHAATGYTARQPHADERIFDQEFPGRRPRRTAVRIRYGSDFWRHRGPDDDVWADSGDIGADRGGRLIRHDSRRDVRWDSRRQVRAARQPADHRRALSVVV